MDLDAKLEEIFSDYINYDSYEIAFSCIPKKGGPATGKVPHYITVLGARKRPMLELPAAMFGLKYGGCESEGGSWILLQEMLAEMCPLDEKTKKLNGGNWKEPVKHMFASQLKGIAEKIGERYCIAEIEFGFTPTIENVYKRNQMHRKIKERLTIAYGKVSSSVAVV